MPQPDRSLNALIAAALPMRAPQVRGGGGVVVRRGDNGEPEVLLVHRLAYDDWSLPKGKAEGRDRALVATALREVEEETGLRCRVRELVGQTRYTDHQSRDKEVSYWVMTPVHDAGFTPNAEIDRLAWLPLGAAVERLSYLHDVALLVRAAPALGREVRRRIEPPALSA